jgi:putative ABC transport system permease protein
VNWINTYVNADAYIKPASCSSNFCFYPLPDDVFKTVSQLPGVETVGRFRALQIQFRDKPVIAGFGDSSLLWKRQGAGKDERERLQRLARYREVLVSDYLSVKYGLKKGDTIEIPTPKGSVSFTINNTSISYSTMSGFMYFDRRWLQEYWGLDDATQLSVYLGQGGDSRHFIEQVKKILGSRYALEITDNRELRRSVLEIFDKSFAITYAIEIIAIVISLLGVVNALLILVLEKKREISVLRYLGAGWRQIRQVMLLSSGMIGIAGIALGSIMGTAISLVITHVINKISFGWEVAFQVPVLTTALLMALLFLTTLLAGIVPFTFARRIDPKAFISFE